MSPELKCFGLTQVVELNSSIWGNLMACDYTGVRLSNLMAPYVLHLYESFTIEAEFSGTPNASPQRLAVKQAAIDIMVTRYCVPVL